MSVINNLSAAELRRNGAKGVRLILGIEDSIERIFHRFGVEFFTVTETDIVAQGERQLGNVIVVLSLGRKARHPATLLIGDNEAIVDVAKREATHCESVYVDIDTRR